jgi:hypothetical protein
MKQIQIFLTVNTLKNGPVDPFLLQRHHGFWIPIDEQGLSTMFVKLLHHQLIEILAEVVTEVCARWS